MTKRFYFTDIHKLNHDMNIQQAEIYVRWSVGQVMTIMIDESSGRLTIHGAN